MRRSTPPLPPCLPLIAAFVGLAGCRAGPRWPSRRSRNRRGPRPAATGRKTPPPPTAPRCVPPPDTPAQKTDKRRGQAAQGAADPRRHPEHLRPQQAGREQASLPARQPPPRRHPAGGHRAPGAAQAGRRLLAAAGRGVRAHPAQQPLPLRRQDPPHPGGRRPGRPRGRHPRRLDPPGGVGFRRSGGANTTHFELQDINFLGTGKGISLLARELRGPHRQPRSATTTRASSAPTGGSTWPTPTTATAPSSSLSLERPFYSLDTRWALGVQATLDDRVDPLYDRGHVSERFQHRQDVLGVYAGLSPGLADRQHPPLARRLLRRARPLRPGRGLRPAGACCRATAPWPTPGSSYDYLQDGYFTARDMDRIQRTEDVNVGRQFHLRLGYSSTAWGGTLNRVVTDTSAVDRLAARARGSSCSPSSRGSARFGGGGAENLLIGGSLRYYVRDFGDNLFYAALGGDVGPQARPRAPAPAGRRHGAARLPPALPPGGPRLLLTLEQRFFSSRELFHLVHFGAAVFFDAGSAWFEDGDGKVAADRKLLKDVGLGLRFGSSRSCPRLDGPPRPRLPAGRRPLDQARAVAGVDQRHFLIRRIGRIRPIGPIGRIRWKILPAGRVILCGRGSPHPLLTFAWSGRAR